MDHHLAAETLEQVQEVRRSTRSDLRAFWFPLVVFGAVTIVSAAVVAAAGGEALAVYWPVAGTAGGILTGWYYGRREHQLGIEGSATPYIATAVAIMVGAMLAGVLGSQFGSGLAGAVGPSVVVAAGYFVFARLERSTTLAALAGIMLALAVGVAFSGMDADPATIVLGLTTGSASLLTGVFQRRRVPAIDER
jgi:hypothetical protein